MRRRAQRLAALMLGAGLISACTPGPSTRPELVTSGPQAPASVSSAPATTLPTGPGGPGRTSSPVHWEDCPAYVDPKDAVSGRSFTLDCAEVTVPRLYSAPSGRKYAITVTRALAPGTADTAPVLVTVLDGPGSNGSERAASVAGGLPASITAHYAIVVIDLRGTGESAPVDCVDGTLAGDLLSLPPDPSTPTDLDVLSELNRNLTFSCGDEAGTALSTYSTVAASDDLDTIRAALGTETLNFLGRGYGATLGAVYADRYPGRIAAMVLDSPTDPLLTLEQQGTATAKAAETALDSFAAGCPTFSGGCPLGSDPRSRVEAIARQLGEVGVPDSEGHLVSGGSVLLTLLLELGRPNDWPALADALHQVDTGDPDKLSELLLQAVGGNDRRRVLAGQLLYGCNDSAQRLAGTSLTAALDTARKAAPFFGPFTMTLISLCGSWPVPDAPLGTLTAKGAVPILVLGSVNDPLIAYSTVQSLAGHLASAVLVSWQSETHGSYPASSCMTETVNSYLLDGTVPADGTLCPP